MVFQSAHFQDVGYEIILLHEGLKPGTLGSHMVKNQNKPQEQVIFFLIREGTLLIQIENRESVDERKSPTFKI